MYILLLCNGIAAGWVLAFRETLQSRTNPLHSLPYISREWFPWSNSILYVGGLAGLFVWNNVTDKGGRKATGSLAGLTQVVGWIGITFGDSSVQLLVGRFIVGVGACGVIINSLLYINETASAGRRASLLSLSVGILGFGYFLAYPLAAIFPYNTVNVICTLITIIYMLMYRNLPETPMYYLLKGNAERAKWSMLWYRGSEAVSAKEVLDLQSHLNLKNPATYKELLGGSGYAKSTVIAIVLLSGLQLCGISFVLFYSDFVFFPLKAKVSNFVTMSFLGTVHLIVCSCFVFVINKVEKKKFLLISYTGVFILFLIMFGVLILERVSDLLLSPVLSVSLVCFVLFYNIGIGPIPLVMVSEMFPPHLLNNVLSISMVFLVLIGYGFNQILLRTSASVNHYNVCLTFVISNLAIVLFILKFISSAKYDIKKVYYQSNTSAIIVSL